MPTKSLKSEIINYGRLLYRSGLIQGSNGNLSIIDRNKIIITPSGFSLNDISEVDLVVINKQGEKKSGRCKASSEKLMHLFVYQKRPDIHACCHAHPPYATVRAVTGEKLRSDIMPESVLLLGEVATTEYARPGTEEVPASMEKYILKHDVFILANHGVLTIGRNIAEAFNRMEAVEHLAKISYIARQTGKMNFLDKKETARLTAIRRRMLQGK